MSIDCKVSKEISNSQNLAPFFDLFKTLSDYLEHKFPYMTKTLGILRALLKKNYYFCIGLIAQLINYTFHCIHRISPDKK